MPHVQIRNVPPELHAALVKRAAASGQSLQQYLLRRLGDVESQLTMSEWVAMVESHRTPDEPLVERDWVTLIREDRESH
jgi:hypothetical protein